ncbi:MAG: hypothetical protein RR221_07550 [Alistipes sp.]
MEYFNGRICATYDDLAGILSVRALQCKVQRGQITKTKIGGNGRVALFAVDTLPLKCQTELYRRFPDMKAQAESKPFIESIEPDGAALNFYETYSLGEGKYLGKDKVAVYANNAAILNAFHSIIGRYGRKTAFWNEAAQALLYISKTLPNSLPKNARRLQEKYNQYQSERYSALISGKYNTRNAAKK